MYNGNQISVQPIEGDLIELCFNAKNASVNVFNNATVTELSDALRLITDTQGIKGMLITSAKPVFIVGADITEFKDVFVKPADEMKAHFGANNDNFNLIEDLPFPSVVAINGFALGGGLEFCLACDYRIMANDTKIGLPETGLGIIPGWGGTVRTPRLIGLENAMAWMAGARHKNASDAKLAGLIDAATDDTNLRNTALNVLNNAILNPTEYQDRRRRKTSPLKISDSDAKGYVLAAKEEFCKRSPHLKAPSAVIDLLAEAISADRTQALELESNLFIALTKSEQARALIGIFVSEQYINKVAKDFAKLSSLKIEKASVVGAGIMGGGIAYQNALKNIPVVMKDINENALELGMQEANKLLSKKVQRGRISEDTKLDTLNLISPTLNMSDLHGANVIVEAVVESPKVKESVLADLEETLSDDDILVSNTSTISISRLARALKRPEKFAGMHFFNPVHAMPLVEIIRGKQTSEETITDVVAYSLAIGKKPIVVNDCPAFLVNRVLFPYFRAFELLIRDGADFEAVDHAMEAWGWPMGPAYLSDVCGIDTIHHCQEVLAIDLPDRMGLVSPSVIDVLYKNQRYGQKNNQGFFSYKADSKGRPQRSEDDTAKALIDSCQAHTGNHSDSDIVIRCMLPMAIEMARCIEENIVNSAAEADMALIYGLGFPAFRGGILRWMDEVGVGTLCEWSDKFSYLGEAYRATDGMKKLANTGGTYY